MSSAETVRHRRQVSDAPLRSVIERDSSERTLLKRELDDPWRTDPKARRLFLAEIEAGVRISAGGDPGLVPLAAAQERPEPWLTREYSTVGTLDDRIRRGPALRVEEILTATGGVLAALDALQRLGLAHGDPSPSNLLLTPEGRVRLADAVSCRRQFAEEPLPIEEELERDRRRLLSWLRSSLLSSVSKSPDRLAYRLLVELDAPETTGEIVAGVRHILADSRHLALPVGPPDGTETSACPPPAPIHVAFALGPVRDSRASYLAAKSLAASEGGSVLNLRKQISRNRVTVDVLYPEPGRSLAASLKAGGVEVEVRARTEAAPEVGPPAETAPAGEASTGAGETSEIPPLDVVPLRGLPGNLRRLRGLAGKLYAGREARSIRRLAWETSVAALWVLANLVLAHTILLSLLGLLFLAAKPGAR